MISRLANLTGRWAILLVFTFSLASCGGGGGGGGGGSFLPEDDDDNDPTYYLAMVLLNALGEVTNTVTSTKPVRLEVTVLTNNKNGNPVPDVVVSASAQIANIVPDSGTALTDENGVASFRVEAGNEVAAGEIIATVDSPSGQVQETLNFQVKKADLRIGYINDGNFIEGMIEVQPDETLAPGGSATLSFAVVDEFGNLAQTTEQVRLFSQCISAGLANITPANPVSFIGRTTVGYNATGCEGDDEVIANLIDTPNQATGTVSIAPLSSTANTIKFDDANPRVIVPEGTGTGNREESTEVVFIVTDADGKTVPGVDVTFELSTSSGGLALEDDSGTTNSQGFVTARVNAGDSFTTFFVFATITEKNVSTSSDLLAVSSGLPVQRFSTLSMTGGGNVIENGFNRTDATRTIKVRLLDHFGVPVPNGTLAVFDAEYGDIDVSCSTGLENGAGVGGVPEQGECSVLWTSKDPKTPPDAGIIKTIYDINYRCSSHNGGEGPCPSDLGEGRGGRGTISFSADGEEDFEDKDNNNSYDEGEDFDNLPEAFGDDNEDDVHTPSQGPDCGSPTTTSNCTAAGANEPFTDINDDDEYNTNDDPAIYNGLFCPPGGNGDYCSTELVSVRDDLVVILSDATSWDSVLVNDSTGRVVTGTSERGGTIYVAYFSDIHNNPPPAGSKISVTPLGDCELVTPSSYQVPNRAKPGAFGVDIQTEGDGGSGNVQVRLDSSDGSTFTKTYGCESTPPPDPNGLVVGG
jgi:hypothetical protein